MKGALDGVTGEREAARRVRAMFGRVAHRYDLANHLLSFNIDRHWRARTVARVRPALDRPGARVLDLCCGTGDLLLALGAARSIGADFCHPMLVRALDKGARAVVEADALALPLAGGAFDLVTTAFGFRNLANYRRRAGGNAARAAARRHGRDTGILAAAKPPFRSALRLLLAPHSAARGRRSFGLAATPTHTCPNRYAGSPPPDELAEMMRQAGFADVRYERMTGGIVALHTGVAE